MVYSIASYFETSRTKFEPWQHARLFKIIILLTGVIFDPLCWKKVKRNFSGIAFKKIQGKDSFIYIKLTRSQYAAMSHWLFERNWFTFGSPRSSKKEPGIKTFFILYDKRMYLVHKQTENQAEVAFYHFFISQRVVLQTFKCIHLVPVYPQTTTVIWHFSVCLWLL